MFRQLDTRALQLQHEWTEVKIFLKLEVTWASKSEVGATSHTICLRSSPCSSQSFAGLQNQSCQVAGQERTARHRLGTLTLVLLCPAILNVAFQGLGECCVNCCGSRVKNIAADPGKHGISRNPNNSKHIALCGANMSVRQCVAAGSRVLQTCFYSRLCHLFSVAENLSKLPNFSQPQGARLQNRHPPHRVAANIK